MELRIGEQPQAAQQINPATAALPLFRRDIFSVEDSGPAFDNGVQILRYIDPKLADFLPFVQEWSRGRYLSFCEDISLNNFEQRVKTYLLLGERFPKANEELLDLWIDHMKSTFILSHPESLNNPDRAYAVVLSRTAGSDQNLRTPRTDWHVDEHFTAKPGSAPIRQAVVVYSMYDSKNTACRSTDQFDLGTTEYVEPHGLDADAYLNYRQERRRLTDLASSLPPQELTELYHQIIEFDQNPAFLKEGINRERLPVGVSGIWQAIPGLKDQIHPSLGLVHRTARTTQDSLKFLA